jgi:dihydrofolate synthase/folylpolyglutamate synthase
VNGAIVNFAEAAAWIFSFTNYEVTALDAASKARLELRPLRALLARLGDPQRGRGTVHLTGSKGKGSTAAMIAAMLQAAGERTGLFTSPHLHTVRERMRVDGALIEEAQFAALTSQLRPHAEAVIAAGERLTTFDLITALGFLYFREEGATWQVVEVGLGGTLDSTNVLDEKQLCVFTPIGLEHTAILGDTVAKIATDKAGILRDGVPAVMAPQRESAAEVIRAACAAHGCPLEEVATACQLSRSRGGSDGQELRLRTPRADYRLRLQLVGRFQAENAATAVLGMEQLAAAGVELAPATAATALADLRWPGRAEVLKRSPLVVVDGAHSPESARRLVQTVREDLSHRSVYLIVGASRDKNLPEIAAAFAALDPVVIAVAARQPRAAPAVDVGQAFQDQGMMVRLAPDVAAAVDTVLGEAGPNDLVLATGSLFVVAEAREAVLGLMPEQL